MHFRKPNSIKFYSYIYINFLLMTVMYSFSENYQEFFIHNDSNLFFLRKLSGRLSSKMKSRCVQGQSQRLYQAMRGVQKHQRSRKLIFQENLRALNTREMEIDYQSPTSRVPRRVEHHRLKVLARNPSARFRLKPPGRLLHRNPTR